MYVYIKSSISLNVNKTIFWIVLVVAVAGVILATQIIADTQNEELQEELSIDDLRQISLEEGKIFDDYLIPYEMSPALVEYFGGVEQARSSYNWLNDLMNSSEGNSLKEKANELMMLSFNFHILTDSMIPYDEEISAMVIHERKLAGTYEKPYLGLLQALHTYLETEYPINATTLSLQDTFGDLSVLAWQILEKEEEAVLIGKPQFKLREADLDYWTGLGWYSNCEIEKNGGMTCGTSAGG